MKQDEQAQVGIGTMIVFIATVLVAAIAAGVLISTSSDLQEKSSRTGAEATEQVASNLAVNSVVGKRDATSTATLEDLEIYLVLAPGASEVDLSQMSLQYSDGAAMSTLDYASGGADTDSFGAAALRDADSSFTAANPVMTAGDLVRIDIDLDEDTDGAGADTQTGIGNQLAVREDVRIVLLPEVGSAVEIGFSAPNSYGTRLVMELA